jgi:hypothetical protein
METARAQDGGWRYVMSQPQVAAETIRRRALLVWPRLDQSALRRCGSDPARVAALVGRRSNLPEEAIMGILLMPDVTEVEARTWFG